MNRTRVIVFIFLIIVIFLFVLALDDGVRARRVKYEDSGAPESKNVEIAPSKSVEIGPVPELELDEYELQGRGKEMRKIITSFPKFNIERIRAIDIKADKGKYASKAERVTMESMEIFFPENKFNKIRPNWLKNPLTNRNLELDGYCDELKLAVEYNGIQHYVWPNFTGQSEEEFKKQLYRDDLKRKICIEKEIYLLTVPHTIEYRFIPHFIYNSLLQSVPSTMRESPPGEGKS